MRKLGLTALLGLGATMAWQAAPQGTPLAPSQSQTQTPRKMQAPAVASRAQAPAETTVTVDGSEAMFTTMCALLASGFESNMSSDNWTAFRAQMRERLRQQSGPAVDAVRQFDRQHGLRDAGAPLSEYLRSGLRTGPRQAFHP